MIKTTDILIDIWNAANSPAIQAISPKTTVAEIATALCNPVVC